MAKQSSLRVAACQIFCIDGDREGNFRRIEYALETARREQAEIAAFPESVILGWENPDAHELAGPIPGPDSDRIAALARHYGLTISIGLDEKDGDRLYDSAILVDKTGALLWKHRKMNVLAELMDPPYAEGAPEGIGAVDTEHGRIGMMICADTFIDDYAERMARLKPDVVLVPYGWVAPMDKWPGHAKELEKVVTSRAAQWKCPLVATDSVGMVSQGPWRGRTYGGSSLIADANGSVLALLRDRDAEVRTVGLHRVGSGV